MENFYNYDIGIDIGTDSVGWAVVNNETNKVIRKFNKKLWGVLLFDEASTAAKRRGYRSTRRRYQRRKKRLQLLRKEFQEEILKVDPDFYKKLQEFYLHKEDRKYFSDLEEKYRKEYQIKYPTIFHLRKDLVENEEKKDIRLVYLTIHHILKYRGNFLYENEEFHIESLDIDEKIREVVECFQKFFPNKNTNLPVESLQKILEKKEEKDLREYFKFVFGENEKDWSNMLLGNNFNVVKVFSIDSEEAEEIKKMSFKDDNYEENINKLEKALREKVEILHLMKQLYSMNVLKKLLNGEKYISNIMVKRYQKHQEDLKLLRKVIATDSKAYSKIFQNAKDSIYRKYIRNGITYEEFTKEITNIIANVSETPEKKQLLKEMESASFMPKITSKENGELPYQIHEIELVKIIENQGKYYPFLKEKTTNGNYRIQELMKFRIPYYVGPLNDTTKDKGRKSPFAWACKKENTEITPFNFDEVIDKDASASKFIERMISHCTYLLKEEVLPANSIIYSKFKVLNELKQIKVNDKKISLELEKKIYKELFLKKGKVTEKDLINFFKATGEYDMFDEIEITGYSGDKKFANHMQSFVDFFGPNGIFENKEYMLEDAEQIIKWITVFEDKKILERRIIQEYPDLKDKLPLIKAKNYKGWGNLSLKLLTELFYTNDVNEKKSILDLLEETSDNFMQILHSTKYDFQKMIKEENNTKKLKHINYEIVENLVTSPSNKKGIYLSLKIIEEIIKLMGCHPKNISIEMARNEGEKKRIPDRKKQLEKIYKNYKSEIATQCEFPKIYNQLNKEEKIDVEKLYLYYIQEGKSLYSGIPLKIEELDKYEVDHIIPRTLIKDNSWDNKALVLKEENQNKAASLVLPEEYRTNGNKKWWDHLKKVGLISQKKLYNLTRKKYSEKDIEGFYARQLVETRQICKHVANILENFYEDIKVIYLHADLSHNYREKFELFKFREINDFHHAHDAYLAAVLGNYQKNHLPKLTNTNQLNNMKGYISDEEERKKRLKYGYVINSLDPAFQLFHEKTGELLFDIEGFNKIIEKTLYQNDIIINRKTEIKSGELFNITKNKKNDKVGNPIALKKELDINKYGSYSGIQCACMVLVKYSSKGKQEHELIGLPIMYKESFKQNSQEIEEYFRKLLKLKEEDKLKYKNKSIPFNTLIDWNGCLCYITGAGVELQNAVELKLPKEKQIKWKYTFCRLLKNRENLKKDEEYEKELVEIFEFLLNKINECYPIFKKELIKLSTLNIQSFTVMEKENIIKQIFRMLRCNGENANLKSSGFSDRVGRINGKTIKNGKIITKSVTGIKEKYYEF